jgi:hypothetical protein
MTHDCNDSLITVRMDRFGAGADGYAPGVLPLLGNVERRGLMGGGDGIGDRLVISCIAIPVGTPRLCHLDDGCRLASFIGHVALIWQTVRMGLKVKVEI